MPKVFFSDLDKAHYNLRHLIAANTGDTFRYRTKADLADAIGIAHTTFLRKMKGTSEFTFPELLSLFRLLHTTEADVYKIFCIPKTPVSRIKEKESA